jgi:polysaccharide deacetylase 2 family uncharacterized protein YibQ
MPKLRSKKPKRVKRSVKKNGSLAIYIVVGIFTSLIIWLIVKEPVFVVANEPNQTQSEKGSEKYKDAKPVKKNKNAKKADRQPDIEKAIPLNPAPPKISSHNPQQKTAPVVRPLSMDEAIAMATEKLGIPKSFYRRKKSGDLITYSIPIDKSSMDLVYANMIFKGELERNGGVFIKGTDSSGKQSLTFNYKQSNDKYVINLYYDTKLYAVKQNPRTISIVVDDFGSISGELLEGFLALDPAVCFAIFPDEPFSVLTMQKASAQGRETIIHVPMEPIGYPSVNPGKNAIFVQYDDATIDKLLSRFIKQLPDCEGINNHMGSLATTDEAIMRAVMTTLKKHGKFFLDSRTSNVSVAYSIAQKTHIRSFRNDLFLDSPNINQSTMDAKLSQIVEMSATRSNIIAITHCHNEDKLQYLKRIITRLKAAGYTLVPLSKIGQYNVPGLL